MPLARSLGPLRFARKAIHAVVNRGAWPAFEDVFTGRAARRPAPGFCNSGGSAAVHPFDEYHKTDTSGLIEYPGLKAGCSSDRWSTAYYAVPPSVFRAAMSCLPTDLHHFAFVDLGSGKGRAVMLAALLDFSTVHGVELSPALHAIALSNIESFTRSVASHSRIILTRQDAVRFVFPENPLILFLYHPFCKPVMKRVLANLQKSLAEHPRTAYVVYINAELKEFLADAPFLRPIQMDLRIPLAAEDYLPDRIGSSIEECAIFAARAGCI